MIGALTGQPHFSLLHRVVDFAVPDHVATLVSPSVSVPQFNPDHPSWVQSHSCDVDIGQIVPKSSDCTRLLVRVNSGQVPPH